MQDDIKELKADVKEISKDITDIKVILGANTTSLSEHIKRTTLAEQRIDKIENWLLGLLAAILLAIIGSMFK